MRESSSSMLQRRSNHPAPSRYYGVPDPVIRTVKSRDLQFASHDAVMEQGRLARWRERHYKDYVLWLPQFKIVERFSLSRVMHSKDPRCPVRRVAESSACHRPRTFVAHTMFEEAVLLVVRYSWMTTLLAGVAGRHGSSFGKMHLVSTVQSFTRAIEHTPFILEDALAFVRSRELDRLPGLAKLLRT